MAGLDPLELDIRKWWYLHKKNYEDGSSKWVTCQDWPKWKQIGYLLERIDQLHLQHRQMELAADETRDTEHLSAVYRPRPSTSDDTIPVMWAPSAPSAALTPVKAMPSVPLPGMGDELPQDARLHPSSAASHSALAAIERNRIIRQCQTAAETTFRGCIAHSVNPLDTLARVIKAMEALITQIPMDLPLDDEGYTR